MQRIRAYNCEGLCIERACNRRYTHATEQTIGGMRVILPFCERHAEEFDDYELLEIRKSRLIKDVPLDELNYLTDRRRFPCRSRG